MSKNLLTQNECKQIVGKLLGKKDCNEVKVIDYNVRNYSDGCPGFLGDYFSLTIKFCCSNEEIRKESFFVKSLPINNVKKRGVLEETGILKKEGGVFKDLVPKLLKYSGTTKWAPTCYLSRDDLLVFEDLKLSSYQMLPKHIDLNIHHIKMALRSLAGFQAANIIYERLELRPKGKSIGDTHGDILFETSYTSDNPWCMTGIRALKAVALHKTKYGYGSDYERMIEEKFIEKLSEIFELLESTDTTIPRVCCHRDLWRNNLMYRLDDKSEKPLHCMMIDFQICRYLPLTLDVMICILLPSRDHSNTNEYLKFYYEELTGELMRHDVNIGEIMSWNDFEVSCRRFELFPLVQQAIFSTLTNLPEEYKEYLRNDESEYEKIVLENRDDLVLKFMQSDEYYRETMTEAVERLIEYLFINETS